MYRQWRMKFIQMISEEKKTKGKKEENKVEEIPIVVTKVSLIMVPRKPLDAKEDGIENSNHEELANNIEVPTESNIYHTSQETLYVVGNGQCARDPLWLGLQCRMDSYAWSTYIEIAS